MLLEGLPKTPLVVLQYVSVTEFDPVCILITGSI